jgi:hypothetical protein
MSGCIRRDRLIPDLRSKLVSNPQSLIDKIKALPPERLDEVEDFVDFIAARATERSLTRAAAATSAAVFGKVWSNPEDDVYDAL